MIDNNMYPFGEVSAKFKAFCKTTIFATVIVLLSTFLATSVLAQGLSFLKRPVIFDEFGYTDDVEMFGENQWLTPSGYVDDVAWYGPRGFAPYNAGEKLAENAIIQLDGTLNLRALSGYNPDWRDNLPLRAHAGHYSRHGTWAAGVVLKDMDRSKRHLLYGGTYSLVNIIASFWGTSNSVVRYGFDDDSQECASAPDPGCTYRPTKYWTEVNFEWNNYFGDAPPVGPDQLLQIGTNEPKRYRSCGWDIISDYFWNSDFEYATRQLCDWPYMSVGVTQTGYRNAGSSVGGGISASVQLSAPITDQIWPDVLDCTVGYTSGGSSYGFNVNDSKWCTRAMYAKMVSINSLGSDLPVLDYDYSPGVVLSFSVDNQGTEWTMVSMSEGVGHVTMKGSVTSMALVTQPIAAEFLLLSDENADPGPGAQDSGFNFSTDWYYFTPSTSVSVWDIIGDVNSIRFNYPGQSIRINTTGVDLSVTDNERPNIDIFKYENGKFGIVLAPVSEGATYQMEWSHANKARSGLWKWSPVSKRGQGNYVSEVTSQVYSYTSVQGPGYIYDIGSSGSVNAMVKVRVNMLDNSHLQDCSENQNDVVCVNGENRAIDWLECTYLVNRTLGTASQQSCVLKPVSEPSYIRRMNKKRHMVDK